MGHQGVKTRSRRGWTIKSINSTHSIDSDSINTLDTYGIAFNHCKPASGSLHYLKKHRILMGISFGRCKPASGSPPCLNS